MNRYLTFGVVTLLLAFVNPAPHGISAAATPTVFISEVHPAGSGNGTYNADWFEVTNAGTAAVDITGWKRWTTTPTPSAPRCPSTASPVSARGNQWSSSTVRRPSTSAPLHRRGSAATCPAV